MEENKDMIVVDGSNLKCYKRTSSPVDVVKLLEDGIFEIRGVQVMLDTDVAVLFNKLVKNLNEKYKAKKSLLFPNDSYAFMLTDEEESNLKSKISTSRSHGGKRKNHVVFTKKGIKQFTVAFASKEIKALSVPIADEMERMEHEVHLLKAERVKLMESTFNEAKLMIEQNKELLDYASDAMSVDYFNEVKVADAAKILKSIGIDTIRNEDTKEKTLFKLLLDAEYIRNNIVYSTSRGRNIKKGYYAVNSKVMSGWLKEKELSSEAEEHGGEPTVLITKKLMFRIYNKYKDENGVGHKTKKQIASLFESVAQLRLLGTGPLGVESDDNISLI